MDNTPSRMRATPRKKNDWSAVTPEQWALGYAAVAALMGVTHQAARRAHKYAQQGRATGSGRPARLVMPEGLKATDSPTAVAAAHGVSLPTASKWLAQLGRVGVVGRHQPQPEGNA